MIAWASIPAEIVTRPNWSYQQLQLLEALTQLREECNTTFDINPVLLVDGLLATNTIVSLQSFLNKRLNRCDFTAEILKIDGQFGIATKKALQTFLNSSWSRTAGPKREALRVDGVFEYKSNLALSCFLNSKWDQAGFRDTPLKCDGTFDASAVRALQTYLNSMHHEDQKWKLLFRQRSPFRGGGWFDERWRNSENSAAVGDVN